MNTISNQKMLRSRISAGLDVRPEHYHFAREHRSTAPFADDRRGETRRLVLDIIGTAALFTLLGVLMFFGGQW